MLTKIVSLLRLLAFMVFIYLALGWVVERRSRVPDSQLKAFFRVLCSPVTAPVSRLVKPGTSHERVLVVSLGIVGVVWVLLIVLDEVLRRA